jgi:hypothetical protein
MQIALDARALAHEAAQFADVLLGIPRKPLFDEALAELLEGILGERGLGALGRLLLGALSRASLQGSGLLRASALRRQGKTAESQSGDEEGDAHGIVLGPCVGLACEGLACETGLCRAGWSPLSWAGQFARRPRQPKQL